MGRVNVLTQTVCVMDVCVVFRPDEMHAGGLDSPLSNIHMYSVCLRREREKRTRLSLGIPSTIRGDGRAAQQTAGTEDQIGLGLLPFLWRCASVSVSGALLQCRGHGQHSIDGRRAQGGEEALTESPAQLFRLRRGSLAGQHHSGTAQRDGDLRPNHSPQLIIRQRRALFRRKLNLHPRHGCSHRLSLWGTRQLTLIRTTSARHVAAQHILVKNPEIAAVVSVHILAGLLASLKRDRGVVTVFGISSLDRMSSFQHLGGRQIQILTAVICPSISDERDASEMCAELAEVVTRSLVAVTCKSAHACGVSGHCGPQQQGGNQLKAHQMQPLKLHLLFSGVCVVCSDGKRKGRKND
eukprot:RCo041918